MNNFIYSIIAILYLSGCVKTNVNKASIDIADSKKKGVFISKYSFNNSFIEKDSIQITIKEAWVEHKWVYKNQLRRIIKDESSTMYVSIYLNNNKYFYEYPRIIEFKVEDNDMSGGGFNNIGGSFKLSTWFKEYPDTIRFIFYGDQVVELVKKEEE